MKIGLMNDPAKDVVDEITFAGENGFDFVDLTIEPPKAQVDIIDVNKINSLCQKYHLQIVGHTNFYMPWASHIKRLKDASIQEFSDHFAVFQALGTKVVNIHANWYQPNSPKEEITQRIMQSLKELVVIAKDHGLKLMLENQPNGFLCTPDSLLPVFREVDGLLFHLDVGHAQVSGRGRNLTSDFLDTFKDKLAHVHVSDNKGNNDDHLPLGVGIIKWEDIVQELQEANYDGTITLEVFVPDRQYLLYSKDKIRALWNRKHE